MSKSVIAFATILILHCSGSTSNYPELNPELQMYQDITKVFPLTETWYLLYRNYEEDPVFGTSKCVRCTPAGPEEEGGYPALIEYGDETQSANALVTLASTEGYTSKNQLNVFPDGQKDSLPLYLSFMDDGKCLVYRNVYVNEDACCVVAPESQLGQSTTSCDFVYHLLCGNQKYQISDASCKTED